MVRLAARYADEWNWWVDADDEDADNQLSRLSGEVDNACRELGRDATALRRSVDVFSVVAPNGQEASAELATRLLAYRSMGFDEVRCDVRPRPGQRHEGSLEAMSEVVSLVHEG